MSYSSDDSDGISGFAPLPLFPPALNWQPLLQPPNSPRSMSTSLMFDTEGSLVEVESSSLLQPPNSPITDTAGSESEGSFSPSSNLSCDQLG